MKAVIMAGGQGTRFWPVSREDLPKQFLPLCGERSLIQETMARLKPLFSQEDVFVVCGSRYAKQVRAQLPELSEDQIIIEPAARNTAPCVGLAAVYLRRRYPGEVMAVFPSDHVIQEGAEFERVLKAAAQLALNEWLVTFGIEPSYPATGYGYLRRGKKIGESSQHPAYRVMRFTEKPSAAKAKRLLRSDDYYWNSGMFVWLIDAILGEIETHLPELHGALQEIEQCWDRRERVQEIFSGVTKISIDFGVMERARKVAMLPCRLGWNDVGNWKALEKLRLSDQQGLIANGRYVAIDSGNSVLYTSNGKMVALVGVGDLVVVETPDALLVCDRNRTEEVRQVVERLKERGWKEYV